MNRAIAILVVVALAAFAAPMKTPLLLGILTGAGLAVLVIVRRQRHVTPAIAQEDGLETDADEQSQALESGLVA